MKGRKHDVEDHLLLRDSWRYHPGDNLQWADPAFDDSDWEITNTLLRKSNLPESGWDGIGWYRLHITVDSLLLDKPLIVDLWVGGTAEVYLNGELFYSLGTVGSSPENEIPHGKEHLNYFHSDRQVIMLSPCDIQTTTGSVSSIPDSMPDFSLTLPMPIGM